MKAGETITVKIEKDDEKRVVEIPSDFAEALKRENLMSIFNKMSYTHQKEYVRAVEEAKREETRQRRIEKNIEQLISKRK